MKLDDGFATDPKVLEAGPLGLAMQVAALCYCNQKLTDGRLPRPVAAMLIDTTDLGITWDSIVDQLVALGMWHQPGHDCDSCPPIERGFYLHDYLEFQPSREEVLELRAKRSEAGRKGGLRSRPKQTLKQELEQNVKQNGSKTEAKPEPRSRSRSRFPSSPVPVPPNDVENPDPDSFEEQLRHRAYQITDERTAAGEPIRNRDAYAARIMRDEKLRHEIRQAMPTTPLPEPLAATVRTIPDEPPY